MLKEEIQKEGRTFEKLVDFPRRSVFSLPWGCLGLAKGAFPPAVTQVHGGGGWTSSLPHRLDGNFLSSRSAAAGR